MKDQYAADVGDYGKYGLLRHLFPADAWRLGIVWYLTPPETRKASLRDGMYLQYLDSCSFRNCDAELFDKLKLIARPKTAGPPRSVAEIEKSAVLGKDTVFFSEILDFRDILASARAGREVRLQRREEWLLKALARTRDCEVVFLDPDNGLQIQSTARHLVDGPKFVFMDELQRFIHRADRQQVVVVYHHLNRHKDHGTHAQQIAARKASLLHHIRLTGDGDVVCLRYSPYSPRAFFILGGKKKIAAIRNGVDHFLMTPWKSHFERY